MVRSVSLIFKNQFDSKDDKRDEKPGGLAPGVKLFGVYFYKP